MAKSILNKGLRFFATGLALCFMATLAQAAVQAPHDKVADTTAKVLALVDEAKGYYDKDPQRFHTAIDKLVDPLIDFPGFTRGVMGNYGTKGYYNSLNDQQKADYRKNYARFVKTFREGLVNTYGKGLLAFEGQKTEVLPPTAEDLKLIKMGESVDVQQVIHGKDDKYKVTYKMRPGKNGEWMLKNVTIETINVGLLYRNQFQEAMVKYKEDFGLVVDNWTVKAQGVDDIKKERQAANHNGQSSIQKQ